VLLGTRTEVKEYRDKKSIWDSQLKTAQKKLDDWLSEQKKPHTAALKLAKIDALEINDEEKKTLKEKPDSDAGKKLAKKFEKSLALADDDFRKLFTDEQRTKWDELKKEVEAIKKSGKTEIITLTPEQDAAMRKAMEPVYKDVASRVGQPLIDEFLKETGAASH